MLKEIFLYYVFGEIHSYRLNNSFARICEISPPLFVLSLSLNVPIFLWMLYLGNKDFPVYAHINKHIG